MARHEPLEFVDRRRGSRLCFAAARCGWLSGGMSSGCCAWLSAGACRLAILRCGGTAFAWVVPWSRRPGGGLNCRPRLLLPGAEGRADPALAVAPVPVAELPPTPGNSSQYRSIQPRQERTTSRSATTTGADSWPPTTTESTRGARTPRRPNVQNAARVAQTARTPHAWRQPRRSAALPKGGRSSHPSDTAQQELRQFARDCLRLPSADRDRLGEPLEPRGQPLRSP